MASVKRFNVTAAVAHKRFRSPRPGSLPLRLPRPTPPTIGAPLRVPIMT